MSGVKGLLVLFPLVFFAGIMLGAFFISFPRSSPVDISENQVALLNDRDYFEGVTSFISIANHSIHMVMFDVKYYPDYPDSLASSLLSALGDAAGRGVDVRIITDEFLTEKPVLSMLKEKGANIKFDSRDITTHAKLIIIDSEIVIIGSTNWSYHSIEKNHEANVVIRSPPLAKKFDGYFEKVWAES